MIIDRADDVLKYPSVTSSQTAPGPESDAFGEALAERWEVEHRVEPALAPGARADVILAALAACPVDSVVVAGMDVVAAVLREVLGEDGGRMQLRPGSRAFLRLGPAGLQLLGVGEVPPS